MADYTDRVRTVVQIIQAHRRVSDEVAVLIADAILEWVADPGRDSAFAGNRRRRTAEGGTPRAALGVDPQKEAQQ